MTEWKKSEDALRESEEKFRSTFANAAIGCATAIPDGAFIDANPAYCRLTGYGLDELRSMEFLQMIHPDDRAENMVLIERLLAGPTFPAPSSKTATCEKTAIHLGRKSVSTTPMRREGRNGSSIWSEDITDRKMADVALATARLKPIAQSGQIRVSGAASHDLRQRVQSLVLLQSVAERQLADHPAAQRTVNMMKAAVQGLNGQPRSLMVDAGD